jgi:hypothetical protein
VSIIGVAVDVGTPSNLEFLPLLRVLRVARIFRLIPKARGLRTLLETLVSSLPALGNIAAVLCLFFFIYAVIGMNLFGMMKYGQYLSRYANFSNVGIALLTLFRMITGENWDGLMQDCMTTTRCVLTLQVRATQSFCADASWSVLPVHLTSTKQGLHVASTRIQLLLCIRHPAEPSSTHTICCILAA